MVFSEIVNFKQKIYSRLILAILCSACAQWLFGSVLASLVNFRSLAVPQNVYLLFCNSYDYRIRFFSLLMTSVAGVFIGKDLINLCYDQKKTSRFHSTLKCFSLNTLVITALELIFAYVHFAEYQTMFVVADHPSASLRFKSDAKLFLYFVLVLAFYVTYTKTYHLPFTVIKENRLRRLRTGVQLLFRESLRSGLILTASYLLIFNVFHFEIAAFGQLSISLSAVAACLSKFLLLFAFAVSYLICRRLVDRIFEVFLTQHLLFPIITVPTTATATATTGQFVSMSDAMKERFLSLVQQLACYDFYLMSHFDEERRLNLFHLQEMNSRHLTNWKTTIEDCTDIISKYSRALNEIFEQLTSNLNASSKHLKSNTDSNPARCTTGLRNMSIKQNLNIDTAHLTVTSVPSMASVTSLTNESGSLNSASALDSSVRSKVMQLFLQNTWYKFLFHERLTLKLHYLLENNKPIIWIIDGLVELMQSSLKNDKYGVAAEDFILIIRTLKSLEQQIDKFNKLAFVRKFSAADINFKNEIQLTLRRNYFKINSSIAIFDKKFAVPLS